MREACACMRAPKIIIYYDIYFNIGDGVLISLASSYVINCDNDSYSHKSLAINIPTKKQYYTLLILNIL